MVDLGLKARRVQYPGLMFLTIMPRGPPRVQAGAVQFLDTEQGKVRLTHQPSSLSSSDMWNPGSLKTPERGACLRLRA